ncbi:4-alpha-glucanotransferase [Actinomyces vulturis]|uniref:4-alpha-glucanotransferase n=1 Tax=Actinomyces vulturis TaxID=1857645 RepID=UPI0008296AC7|nr:4-alpha-glucanotransferase [Actinomyces vulturis]
MSDSAPAASPELLELAHAYGVSTTWWDFHGQQQETSAATLQAVLQALGVSIQSPEDIQQAIKDHDLAPWRQVLPPSLVIRRGFTHQVAVHVPDGQPVRVQIHTEDGDLFDLIQVRDDTPARLVDDQWVGQASFEIPADLDLGWHEMLAWVGPNPEEPERCVLACTPDHLDLPTTLGRRRSATSVLTPPSGEVGFGAIDGTDEVTIGEEAVKADLPELSERIEHGCVSNDDCSLSDPTGRGWGLMAQLYSVRSKNSWGVGDCDDLKEMVSFFGDQGADFLLVNPLHAAEPCDHMTQSPYLPVTRRFVNPLYIRPENIIEVARLDGPTRSLISWAWEETRGMNTDPSLLDRDIAWKAKKEALETIFAAGRSRSRQRDFERFRINEGRGLERFALWCALTEKYGDIRDWPKTMRDANSAYVANEARHLRDRIDFYAWMQWIVDEQLRDAQREARASGMALGIMHDLAVGIHPQGADVWAHPEAFATSIGVGAPPDMYNQQGQDWSQPPWNPTYLEQVAYEPLRQMVRTVLRHAGALRVDHILGLFRLWWIPRGMSPMEGAYVRYNHEAMVGVLLLEAYRAGAVIIGEDLGTVEPWVRDYLASRGVLGTSVLWFENQHDGWPLHPEHYRTLALSTVNTHDLPPTAGYLADEHVAVRERLGLLTEPVEVVRSQARMERDRMLMRMREHGLLGEDPTERETVEALYRYVSKTPSALIGVALVDGVGERRTQNQPGTDREYPNWCVPLADGSGDAVMVEDLPGNVRLDSLMAAVRDAMGQ